MGTKVCGVKCGGVGLVEEHYEWAEVGILAVIAGENLGLGFWGILMEAFRAYVLAEITMNLVKVVFAFSFIALKDLFMQTVNICSN